MNSQKQKITISVFVRKPQEEVWNYFTNPDHITSWNFASDDWHCPFAKSELKPKGRFSYTMASKDGKFSFDFSGTFREVVFPDFISYEIDDGRFVEIKFDETPDGTLIIETFEAENVHTLEAQKNGWQSILDNFRFYAEK